MWIEGEIWDGEIGEDELAVGTKVGVIGGGLGGPMSVKVGAETGNNGGE